jgi:DNA-binding IclR family transcriptional regulator
MLFTINEIETMTKKPGRGVQSIEVGGRLLNTLASSERPLMLRDLAQFADLTSGQAHAYLVSFRALGLVEQDPATGRYQLGPFALKLGLARLRRCEPLQIIWDAVPAFAESVNLMVTMSIWTEYGPMVLRLHEAPFQVYSNIRAGARYSLTNTATGRLFAALMPATITEPVLRAELERTDATNAAEGVAYADYIRGLDQIRVDKCACTEGRPVPDISAIAAPVFDLNDQLVAVVTVMGRRGLVECGPDGRHRRAVVEFVAQLSAQLGHLAKRAVSGR